MVYEQETMSNTGRYYLRSSNITYHSKFPLSVSHLLSVCSGDNKDFIDDQIYDYVGATKR